MMWFIELQVFDKTKISDKKLINVYIETIAYQMHTNHVKDTG